MRSGRFITSTLMNATLHAWGPLSPFWLREVLPRPTCYFRHVLGTRHLRSMV